MFNSNCANVPLVATLNDGNSNSNGWGGDWAWWIVILLIFGWGNNGFGGGFGGNGGTYLGENYALISDNATLERKIDGVYAGICDSTFALNNTMTNGFASAQNTMTQGFAGLNTALIQQGYEGRIATQGVGNTVQNCCCDLKQQIGDVKYTIGSTSADISRGVERGFADTNYNMATQANMLDRTVSDKFCQTNFNMQTNTRDVIDSQNAGTQAILAKLNDMETNRLREKLEAERDAKYALQGQLDRAQLRTDIVNDVRPCPKPAYITCNPFGCNCQNGYNYGYGTTIA